MPAVAIQPDVFWVGVNDHTTDLFEGLWPITLEGLSYNSYFIKAACFHPLHTSWTWLSEKE